MDMWIVWLIVMGILLIIEVLSMMMVALCLAVGCVGGFVVALCGLSVMWQVILTAAVSLGAYLFLIPLFQKWHAMAVDRKGKAARTGMDALLGRKAVVANEIRPDGLGRVQIDGDNWQVRATGCNETIPRGSEVVVVGYDSIILDVKPVTAP